MCCLQGSQGGFGSSAQSSYVGANQGSGFISSDSNQGSSFNSGGSNQGSGFISSDSNQGSSFNSGGSNQGSGFVSSDSNQGSHCKPSLIYKFPQKL